MKSKSYFFYNCNYLFLISSILLLIGTQSAAAQPYPLTAIAECNIGHTINPGGSTQKTIELYQCGAVSYFEYYNMSNVSQGCFLCYSPIVDTFSAYRFDLPDDIHVTDFVQIMSNDQIAFCGWINVNHNDTIVRRGVVGWVDWFNSVTQTNMYYMIIDDVKYFETIDAYYVSDVGEVSIVAIAKEVQGTTRDGIFHTYKTSPLHQQTWSYNLYPVSFDEHFWNIVGTQDFEVFVGVDDKGLCLRREYYPSLQSPVELNNVYSYAVPDGEPSTKTKSTLLGNRIIRSQNDIVVGSPTFSSSQIEARFRVINTTNMDMINSQKFYLPSKTDMFGMCFTTVNGMLSVLMASEPNILTSHPSVVLMRPYNTVIYTTDFLYNPQYYFRSIDRLRQFFTNVYQNVLGSFDNYTITWFEADSGVPVENQCYRVGNTRVLPMENVITTTYTDPLDDIGTNTTLFFRIIVRQQETVNVNCYLDYAN